MLLPAPVDSEVPWPPTADLYHCVYTSPHAGNMRVSNRDTTSAPQYLVTWYNSHGTVRSGRGPLRPHLYRP
jgi:hypothetical protein